MKPIKLSLLYLFISLQTLCAQDIYLDYSFNFGGVARLNNSQGYKDCFNSVALQPDGKIVAAGYSYNQQGGDFLIARYNTNGTLDNTFGGTGIVSTDFMGMSEEGNSVVVQPDGKIVVLGWAEIAGDKNFALARYNPNGSLDNSFANGGKLYTDIVGGDDFGNSLLIQPDGKIVAGGKAYSGAATDFDFCLARYLPQGILDTTFSGDGKLIYALSSMPETISSILLQTDSCIIAVGQIGQTATANFAIARFKDNGDIDSTFNSNGNVITDVSYSQRDYANSAVLQSDGKIIAIGTAMYQASKKVALVRYNNNGSLDASFGNGGISTDELCPICYEFGVCGAIQPNGKLMVSGYESGEKVMLVRYTQEGVVDLSFDDDGMVLVNIINVDSVADQPKDMLIQPDGKIVVVGFSKLSSVDYQSFVIRYDSLLDVGLLEFSLTETTPLLYPNPLKEVEHLKYTLKKNEQISIVLLDGQGKLVTTFVENEKQPKGNHEVELNLPTGLPNGTYFIQIVSPKGKISIKTIK